MANTSQCKGRQHLKNDAHCAESERSLELNFCQNPTLLSRCETRSLIHNERLQIFHLSSLPWNGMRNATSSATGMSSLRRQRVRWTDFPHETRPCQSHKCPASVALQTSHCILTFVFDTELQKIDNKLITKAIDPSAINQLAIDHQGGIDQPLVTQSQLPGRNLPQARDRRTQKGISQLLSQQHTFSLEKFTNHSAWSTNSPLAFLPVLFVPSDVCN